MKKGTVAKFATVPFFTHSPLTFLNSVKISQFDLLLFVLHLHIIYLQTFVCSDE